MRINKKNLFIALILKIKNFPNCAFLRDDQNSSFWLIHSGSKMKNYYSKFKYAYKYCRYVYYLQKWIIGFLGHIMHARPENFKYFWKLLFSKKILLRRLLYPVLNAKNSYFYLNVTLFLNFSNKKHVCLAETCL